MSKATVTRLFAGAILATVAGSIVAVATALNAIAGGVVTIGGPTVVTVDGGALAGALPWLAIASLIGGLGALGALGAWVGALVNTVRLDDKTWFVALLVLGLCSFGWVAMVAYVIAGPDGWAPDVPGRGMAAAGES